VFLPPYMHDRADPIIIVLAVLLTFPPDRPASLGPEVLTEWLPASECDALQDRYDETMELAGHATVLCLGFGDRWPESYGGEGELRSFSREN
jgi:hypothetical protein